jgi:hypothetical protein
MKKINLIAIIIFLFATTSVLLADKHSKKEVADLITEVETRLDAAKSEGAENYAGKEVSRIEDLLKDAKKQLDDNERDIAFYMIGRAKSYFKLIDARKELLDAETELKSAQELKKASE